VCRERINTLNRIDIVQNSIVQRIATGLVFYITTSETKENGQYLGNCRHRVILAYFEKLPVTTKWRKCGSLIFPLCVRTIVFRFRAISLLFFIKSSPTLTAFLNLRQAKQSGSFLKKKMF